jgi:hypothetical protein
MPTMEDIEKWRRHDARGKDAPHTDAQRPALPAMADADMSVNGPRSASPAVGSGTRGHGL